MIQASGGTSLPRERVVSGRTQQAPVPGHFQCDFLPQLCVEGQVDQAKSTLTELPEDLVAAQLLERLTVAMGTGNWGRGDLRGSGRVKGRQPGPQSEKGRFPHPWIILKGLPKAIGQLVPDIAQVSERCLTLRTDFQMPQQGVLRVEVRFAQIEIDPRFSGRTSLIDRLTIGHVHG